MESSEGDVKSTTPVSSVPYPHVAHAEFIAIIQVVLEAALYQAFIVKGA
jgi:hypothetical protein